MKTFTGFFSLSRYSSRAAQVAAKARRLSVSTTTSAGSISVVSPHTTFGTFVTTSRKKSTPSLPSSVPVSSLSPSSAAAWYSSSTYPSTFAISTPTSSTRSKSGPLMTYDRPFQLATPPPSPPYTPRRRYSIATATSEALEDRKVRIVEVGARDGLQNEKTIVPVKTKIELIERLSGTGLRNIEAGSFVSPKWVPQMADTSTILTHLSSLQHQKSFLKNNNPDITYTYLIPNLRGLESALATQTPPPEIAIFASASEGFSHANINCSIAESLNRFLPVVQLAQQHNIPIRGYVSMIFSCPYDGTTPVEKVSYVTQSLLDMGCYEVSLGDTNGVGTPDTVSRLLHHLVNEVGIEPSRLAAHFHDTYGMAIVNAMRALQFGIRVFDSSVAGLGGCPYAKGATGNVATEDLVYFFEGMGYNTGTDLEKLAEIGEWISKELGRRNGSKVGPAVLAVREREREKMEKGGKL